MQEDTAIIKNGYAITLTFVESTIWRRQKFHTGNPKHEIRNSKQLSKVKFSNVLNSEERDIRQEYK